MPGALLPRLRAAFHSAPVLSTYVPTVLSYDSAGISTCCPSATPSGLALGPDLPRADQLYPGNLGYSAVRIPTLLSLLIPAFSLPGAPRLLPVPLRRASNAPLPTYLIRSCASVPCFSPGHFRRRTSRPVSYYALFECMAASEPTSWLFFEIPHPFPLNTHFGTLAAGLGSFPFDRPTYLVRSDSRTSFMRHSEFDIPW